jgi:hypothetical protein
MNDALDRSLERLVQLRAAQRARMQSAIADAVKASAPRVGPHHTGARVFDTVTGQEGEVIGRTRENVLVPVTAE